MRNYKELSELIDNEAQKLSNNPVIHDVTLKSVYESANIPKSFDFGNKVVQLVKERGGYTTRSYVFNVTCLGRGRKDVIDAILTCIEMYQNEVRSFQNRLIKINQNHGSSNPTTV